MVMVMITTTITTTIAITITITIIALTTTSPTMSEPESVRLADESVVYHRVVAGATRTLFVHEMLTSSAAWPAAWLGSGETAAWDLPGHGASPPSASPVNLASLVQGVLEALDRLQWSADSGPVRGIGHGLGARILVHAAQQAPRRWASLDLIALPGDLPSSGRENLRRLAAVADRDAMVSALGHLWLSPERVMTHPDALGWVSRLFSFRDPGAATAILNAASEMPDLAGTLAPWSIPTRTVFGRDDLIAPVDAAAPLLTELQARTVIVDGGHIPWLEDPRGVDAALEIHP
jgi:pimeloyl-ACP methyl ester carboxylesterase